MTILRLILGDQLSGEISSLVDCDKSQDFILMCEIYDEARYVMHHKKKIAFLFSGMRHFAEELRQDGYKVHYTKLDDKDNSGSFLGEIQKVLSVYNLEKIVITFPGEYRVLKDIRSWEEALNVSVEIRRDDRFLSSPEFFKTWSEGRKQLRMEYFYREMRKMYHILMDGDQPQGGKWNYDSENRKPPKEGLNIPQTYLSTPDEITKDVMRLVNEHFSDHFGDLEPFHFAVTREQALHALDQFISSRLSQFGDYQDAMIQGEPWMYHSHLSFYINCGLLNPLECVQKAEEAYKKGLVALNAVEGFVRQIIGWREFVRGVYWLKMPDYERLNFLEAKRKLPEFYWTGETQMNCLRQCVMETKENAYAHHIQRLMVLGNFALIAGLDPNEVNEWYLIVYADAYQWVELPNVTGMVLFADGGVLGSKPYAASGAYINKMSDYCKSCRYKVSKKNGPEACPFNYLYWDFLFRNEKKLSGNNRLSMVYNTLRKMESDKVDAIHIDAKRFFKALEKNEKV